MKKKVATKENTQFHNFANSEVCFYENHEKKNVDKGNIILCFFQECKK